MQTPRICERVRVRGRESTFFVVSVDEDRMEVDLIPVFGSGAGLNAVTFLELLKGDSGADSGEN